jgi:hypothetical protein
MRSRTARKTWARLRGSFEVRDVNDARPVAMGGLRRLEPGDIDEVRDNQGRLAQGEEMAGEASVVFRHGGDRGEGAETFSEHPTLGWLAAVNADVGPVKRRDRHRTRLSRLPG